MTDKLHLWRRRNIMSLLCCETREDIEFGDTLMAATRPDADFYFAVSIEVLNRIPKSYRHRMSCKPGDGGVNIHSAFSTWNLNGNYTVKGFVLRGFAFSIAKETAETYLPNYLKLYQESVRAALRA